MREREEKREREKERERLCALKPYMSLGGVWEGGPGPGGGLKVFPTPYEIFVKDYPPPT